ncbi:uncharacterized protein A4U43_C06F8290 [Asparagus officinalis]|uniref:Uncharacterized protein n=1 Tax=Asparagus officinalis TaxID=4686 RepID=A0A5P1EKD0_ASPOF|nr:uncharacterized protein A4U43_C06F8290 [Asparagus officinalis]
MRIVDCHQRERSRGGGRRIGADAVKSGGWMASVATGRRRSQDWDAGTEIPESGGTISSAPSMRRGTVCYVAPEYDGGGPSSEKCDIYIYLSCSASGSHLWATPTPSVISFTYLGV